MTRDQAILFTAALACVPVLAGMPAICAAAYPDKPISVVVAFPAGGGGDIGVRQTLGAVSNRTGFQFVVDNRAGAGGLIGASFAAKAAPDGYTIFHGTATTLAIAPAFRRKDMPYDPIRDFTPISHIGNTTVVILANADLPANNVTELIALAKKQPGTLSYGTNGIGGTYHLEMELFKQQFGINLEQVPYKTSIEAINALVAGEIPLVYAPVGAVMPLVRAGKMRLLVVLDNKRYPDLPNVPAMGEEISGYQRIPTGLNFYGPAGLPPAISRRIHAEVVKALQSPEVPPKLKEFTFFGIGTSPEALAEQQVKDYEIGRAHV